MIIEVPGIPATKGSHRIRYHHGAPVVCHDNKRLPRWHRAIATAAKVGRARIIARPQPVKVALTFFIERPPSVKRASPTVAPDLDKLARAVLDALTGIAYEDDSQVVVINATKVYAGDKERPGVVIRIEPYNPSEEMPF